MAGDWFQQLTGFRERSYEETQQNLETEGRTLRSRVNGRSYGIGELETPSLGELRTRALSLPAVPTGRVVVSSISGDVGDLHRQPANRHALFQVASQFNLLEMTGPEVTPEDGVTRYMHDHTQGPACAVAAGAATIYRNYLVPVEGQPGQTRHRQIDCLRDLGTALGNDTGELWTMRNGYAWCSEHGLDVVRRQLEAIAEAERDALRDLLRVGVHWGVQVTGGSDSEQHVSQAFCSALPISYTSVPPWRWEPFARLVLEAAYEATIWAAVLNAQRFGSKIAFLTHVGGGAFGNARSWINDAITRALVRAQRTGVALDVRIVSYGTPERDVLALVRSFG